MRVESRAEVGSSNSTSDGLFMSARPIATRWRWPPESWEAGSRAGGPSELVEELVGTLLGAAAPPAPPGELVDDEEVLPGGEKRHEVHALKHEADFGAAEVGELAGRVGGDVVTPDQDRAGGLLSPTAGTVLVGGHDISAYSARQLTDFRRAEVGFVFQSVNLVPFLTARENLLVVDELAGRRRRRGGAKQRADQLLDELGLAHRRGNLPSQLSGGQRQRVAIGRALMNNPSLVLFDEPTSALDSTLGDQVVRLIRDEMKARGTTAVIVTHDDRITHYGDRTVHIEDGRVTA